MPQNRPSFSHQQRRSFAPPSQLAKILFALGALPTLATTSGCFDAPEKCVGCLLSASGISVDGGGLGGGGQGPDGSGGAPSGSGGSGTGGMIATTGGAGGTATATGGAASGGSGVELGGRGGSGLGGSGSGGAPSASGGAPTGGSGTGGMVASTPDPDLVLWYKFDETSGITVADSAVADGAAQNGSFATIGSGGTATFTPMKQVGTHAALLAPAASSANSNGGYVHAVSMHALAPQAITLAIWVNLTANSASQNWERIFDFGTGTGTTPNFYLTARASDAPNTPIRFAISKSGHADTAEQRLDGTSTLTPNVWHHIAVVLPAGAPYTGTLYIDGAAVATNPAMTLHASDIGATTNNWLGRSQFSAGSGTNPCFAGLLDDFRVYRRALTASEIAALIAVR